MSCSITEARHRAPKKLAREAFVAAAAKELPAAERMIRGGLHSQPAFIRVEKDFASTNAVRKGVCSGSLYICRWTEAAT